MKSANTLKRSWKRQSSPPTALSPPPFSSEGYNDLNDFLRDKRSGQAQRQQEKPEAEKRIEYHKLKKLVKHLVRSSDRSMLVVKKAPERIYTLTTATVILRALLKYFGVSNIVVSDFGVKEGYLSLITSGKRKGIETDLSELPALSAEAPKKQKSAKKGRSESKTEALTEKTLAANGAKKEKKRKEVLAENRTEKKNSEEKGDGEKTEIPKKKRGRPRKRPTEGLEAEPRKEV